MPLNRAHFFDQELLLQCFNNLAILHVNQRALAYIYFAGNNTVFIMRSMIKLLSRGIYSPLSTALTSEYYTHCTVVHSLHGLHDIALAHKFIIVLTPLYCTYYTDHGTTLPIPFLLIFIPHVQRKSHLKVSTATCFIS